MSKSPLLSLLGLAALAPGALAQAGGLWSELDETRGPELRSHYGFSVAFLDDLNGDGVSEILVGAPLATNGSTTSDGYAEVLDGATRAVLRTHLGVSSPGGALGYETTRLGDLDGDGIGDYALGEPNGSASRDRIGLVHAYSGATGDLIWTAEGSQPWADFGAEIVATADVSGDGIPDLVVSERDWSRSIFEQYFGRVHLLSGADGSRLHTLHGAETRDQLGQRIGLIGDLDGDGVQELGIHRRGPAYDTPGYLAIYSLMSMERLTELVGPPAQIFDLTGWGQSFCGLGDLNGDGHDEFAITAETEDAFPWVNSGSVTVYDGRTAELVWKRKTDVNYGYFGRQIANAGDQDGDGVPDLLVSEPGRYPGGAVHLLSGVDGRRLAVLEGEGNSDVWGFALDAGADLDGDGISEFLIGALEDDVFRTFEGRLEVVSWNRLITPSARVASNGQGGSLSIDAHFPASEAGASYQLMLSTSGTGPVFVQGLAVPLTRDQLFGRSNRGKLGSNFANAVGTLNAAGDAQIDFAWAPGHFTGQVGRSYWACVVSFDAAGPRLASAAAAITIVR
ncbi:MAG: hypothetical protein CMJ94_14600 [Planctomycetes bacterium]|nr:hypothetical protein [Planctomycetota bacterium]